MLQELFSASTEPSLIPFQFTFQRLGKRPLSGANVEEMSRGWPGQELHQEIASVIGIGLMRI